MQNKMGFLLKVLIKEQIQEGLYLASGMVKLKIINYSCFITTLIKKLKYQTIAFFLSYTLHFINFFNLL